MGAVGRISVWKCEGETTARQTVCRRSPGISGERAVFGAGTAKRSGCVRDRGKTWGNLDLRRLHYTVHGRNIPYTKILCREQGQSPVCRSDRTVECYGKECGQLRKCSCYFHIWNTESQCLSPFGRCLKPPGYQDL